MLLSDFKSQVLPMHYNYKIIFDDRGTKYTGFNASVIRGLIPGELPVKLPFDDYNRPKLEQFLLLAASQNVLTVADVISMQTSPPTDLEIVFEVNESARFVSIVTLINDNDQSVVFYN